MCNSLTKCNVSERVSRFKLRHLYTCKTRGTTMIWQPMSHQMDIVLTHHPRVFDRNAAASHSLHVHLFSLSSQSNYIILNFVQVCCFKITGKCNTSKVA